VDDLAQLGDPGRLAFPGEAAGEPVRLTGSVVIDLLKTERLEPPRGPGADVSLKIGAVDNHRPVSVETGGAL
jgi:hypothetical protein